MHLHCWILFSIFGRLVSSYGPATLIPRQMNADWANISCPSDQSITLPTPTYGDEGAIFTVCTETLLHAPAKLAYNSIIDFASYPLWNTFVVDVEARSTPSEVQIGSPLTFTTTGLIPLVNTTSDEIVTVLEDDGVAGYLLSAWRSDTREGGVLITAEHPNILVSEGDGSVTRYVSYETYYDELLVDLVALMRSQLQAAFDRQGEDLRVYVESLV